MGELSGPLSEGERWMVLTTLKRNAALTGSWDSVGDRIEASLLERPIEQPEYWLWKAEMNERLPADFEPFFDLIGEPSGANNF